jgi:hypothetical protein
MIERTSAETSISSSSIRAASSSGDPGMLSTSCRSSERTAVSRSTICRSSACAADSASVMATSRRPPHRPEVPAQETFHPSRLQVELPRGEGRNSRINLYLLEAVPAEALGPRPPAPTGGPAPTR